MKFPSVGFSKKPVRGIDEYTYYSSVWGGFWSNDYWGKYA
jgi:hypothetical protein